MTMMMILQNCNYQILLQFQWDITLQEPTVHQAYLVILLTLMPQHHLKF